MVQHFIHERLKKGKDNCGCWNEESRSNARHGGRGATGRLFNVKLHRELSDTLGFFLQPPEFTGNANFQEGLPFEQLANY